MLVLKKTAAPTLQLFIATICSKRIVLLAYLACIVITSTAAAELASPQCHACRDACVSARIACKANACRSNGGKSSAPNTCENVKNNVHYVEGVQACERIEVRCWDNCANSGR